MSFSGNDGIDVTLAVDDKYIVKYVHNPQGFPDFLIVFMYLERTSAMFARTVDAVTDSITKGNMTKNYLNEMLNFRNQNAKNLIIGHLKMNGLRNNFLKCMICSFRACSIFFYLKRNLTFHFLTHSFVSWG